MMPAPAEITIEMVRESLYVAVVCDVLDQLGYRRQSPPIQWRPLTSMNLLAGRCKTTLWADMAHTDPLPYALELQAVDGCREGDVMIAAAGGSMRSGIWGELLSQAARNRGCIGAIVDGAVRDVRQMRSLEFPCWARGTCPLDSLHRQRVVDVDVDVEIGGVVFEPGSLVLADNDGVVVIPRVVEGEALKMAWDKVHAENEVRDAIRGGMKATDAFAKYGVL